MTETISNKMKLHSYIFGLFLFLVAFLSSSTTPDSVPPKKKPSPIEQLQRAINETQNDIEEYYEFKQKNKPIAQSNLTKKDIDVLNTILEFSLEDLKRFNASEDILRKYEEFQDLEDRYEVSKKKLTSISKLLYGVLEFE